MTLITFNRPGQAQEADRFLRGKGFKLQLIPKPRHIGNKPCGIAITSKTDDVREMHSALAAAGMANTGVWEGNDADT